MEECQLQILYHARRLWKLKRKDPVEVNLVAISRGEFNKLNWIRELGETSERKQKRKGNQEEEARNSDITHPKAVQKTSDEKKEVKEEIPYDSRWNSVKRWECHTAHGIKEEQYHSQDIQKDFSPKDTPYLRDIQRELSQKEKVKEELLVRWS